MLEQAVADMTIMTPPNRLRLSGLEPLTRLCRDLGPVFDQVPDDHVGLFEPRLACEDRLRLWLDDASFVEMAGDGETYVFRRSGRVFCEGRDRAALVASVIGYVVERVIACERGAGQDEPPRQGTEAKPLAEAKPAADEAPLLAASPRSDVAPGAVLAPSTETVPQPAKAKPLIAALSLASACGNGAVTIAVMGLALLAMRAISAG